jgi:hypothetical protein
VDAANVAGSCPQKQPGLRVDRSHDLAREPLFAGAVDELAIEGFRLREFCALLCLLQIPHQIHTGFVSAILSLKSLHLGSPQSSFLRFEG